MHAHGIENVEVAENRRRQGRYAEALRLLSEDVDVYRQRDDAEPGPLAVRLERLADVEYEWASCGVRYGAMMDAHYGEALDLLRSVPETSEVALMALEVKRVAVRAIIEDGRAGEGVGTIRPLLRRLGKADQDGVALGRSLVWYAQVLQESKEDRVPARYREMDRWFATAVERLERHPATAAACLVDVLRKWEMSFWTRNEDGRGGRPKDLLERALATAEQHIGPESLAVGLALRTIVFSFAHKRDGEKVSDMFRRALRLIGGALSEDHPEYLDSTWDAEEFLPRREAVELFEQRTNAGGHDYLTVRLLNSLGSALAGVVRFDEAAAALEKACRLHVSSADRWQGEGSVHRLVSTIDRLVAVRGRAGGLKAMEAAFRWAETTLVKGSMAPDELRRHCRFGRAKVAFGLGRFGVAERLLRSCVDESRPLGAVHGYDRWCRPTPVDCMAARGRYDEAEQHLRKALSEATGGNRVDILKRLAEVLARAGKSEAVAEVVEELQDIHEQQLKEWAAQSAKMQRELRRRRRLEGADGTSAFERYGGDEEERLSAMLGEAEGDFGPAGFRMISYLVHLGLYEMKRGRYEEAEVHFNRAYEIERRFHYTYSEECGHEAAIWLSGLLMAQGRFGEVEQVLSRALATTLPWLRILDYGLNSLRFIEGRLTELYFGLGWYSKAEQLLQASVLARRRSCDEERRGYVNTLVQLARCKRLRGRLDEADGLLDEAEVVCRLADGCSGESGISRTRVGLDIGRAEQLLERGRAAEARALLEPAAEWARRSGSPGDELVVETMVVCATVARTCGDLEGALEVGRGIIVRATVGTMVSGDHVARTRLEMAEACRRLGRDDEGDEHLRAAVKAARGHKAPPNVMVFVVALRELAARYMVLRCVDAAAATLDAIDDTCRRYDRRTWPGCHSLDLRVRLALERGEFGRAEELLTTFLRGLSVWDETTKSHRTLARRLRRKVAAGRRR